MASYLIILTLDTPLFSQNDTIFSKSGHLPRHPLNIKVLILCIINLVAGFGTIFSIGIPEQRINVMNKLFYTISFLLALVWAAGLLVFHAGNNIHVIMLVSQVLFGLGMFKPRRIA